jgi:hypothetical protein
MNNPHFVNLLNNLDKYSHFNQHEIPLMQELILNHTSNGMTLYHTQNPEDTNVHTIYGKTIIKNEEGYCFIYLFFLQNFQTNVNDYFILKFLQDTSHAIIPLPNINDITGWANETEAINEHLESYDIEHTGVINHIKFLWEKPHIEHHYFPDQQGNKCAPISFLRNIDYNHQPAFQATLGSLNKSQYIKQVISYCNNLTHISVEKRNNIIDKIKHTMHETLEPTPTTLNIDESIVELIPIEKLPTQAWQENQALPLLIKKKNYNSDALFTLYTPLIEVFYLDEQNQLASNLLLVLESDNQEPIIAGKMNKISTLDEALIFLRPTEGDVMLCHSKITEDFYQLTFAQATEHDKENYHTTVSQLPRELVAQYRNIDWALKSAERDLKVMKQNLKTLYDSIEMDNSNEEGVNRQAILEITFRNNRQFRVEKNILQLQAQLAVAKQELTNALGALPRTSLTHGLFFFKLRS